MKPFRRTQLLLATILAVACERGKVPAPADTGVAKPPPPIDTTAAISQSRSWDENAGPVLLVAADVPTRAFLLVPDPTASATTLASIPHLASVTLIGRGGTVQTGELSVISDTVACVTATLSAAPPPRPWSVGFIGGVVAPLAMDSVETLSHADSVALVIDLTRLASALPNDTAGRFAGLPFVVRTIWRITIPDGPRVVIATLARQINQEATPLQEHTLLLAERGPSDSALTTAYSERSYGDEETIESREAIGAVLLGGNRNPAIIFARDFGDAVAYALVERGSDGHWRARWASPRRQC